MIGSLPLGFAQPLVLLGLLSLPILWWLLRLVPPRPRQIDFPPTRLLFEIAPKEETPARTPWWLTLLRLTLAALVIIAAAGPLWNPPMATVDRTTPLLILLDDGWPAASTWDARLRTADEMIARAEADSRGVAVLPISETERDISLQVAGAARDGFLSGINEILMLGGVLAIAGAIAALWLIRERDIQRVEPIEDELSPAGEAVPELVSA